METDVVQAVAGYAEKVLGREGYRYICAVVANCKMLAIEMENSGEDTSDLDLEALVLAAYLHNISTVEFGYQDHHVKSAEMAVQLLRDLQVPEERIQRVEQAILVHTSVVSAEQRAAGPLEGRILYDADKLGRLSGLAVVTSLIEFGARYPNRAINSEVLAAILRHIEERFVDLYQSLNTSPARNMAQEKFGNTLAFLDGVIEYLSDSTPV
ncbi:MAG TPA: HD domain-containing protein [Ktedonobacteraceae bacterium]|jgi:HD superfamily phosphodiesterase|nr:HD domain-containing protein [Ktedonobacteraceae bacterium]